MTTVKQVAEIALKLLGHVNQRGSIDDNREAKYLGSAPAYADMLQRELLMREGFFNTDNPLAYTLNTDKTYTLIPVPILTNLTDTLKISDDTALRVMPFAMAMQFALIDGDTVMYNTMSINFNNALNSVVVADNLPIDYYGIWTDPDFRQ